MNERERKVWRALMHLKYGEKLSAAQLAEIAGLPDRSPTGTNSAARSLCRSLNLQGYGVVSDTTDGFWVASSAAEIAEYIRQLSGRVRKVNERIDALWKIFSRFHGTDDPLFSGGKNG